MARLTDIKNILAGGADNVAVLEIIQGEQQIWSGTFTDDDGAVNITNFTLEATAKYFTANLIKSGQSYIVQPDTVKPIEPAPAQATIEIEATDAATGEFQFVIPDDLYTEKFNPDLTTDVPIAVILFRYTTGSDTADDPQPKLMHRLIVVIRAGIHE